MRIMNSFKNLSAMNKFFVLSGLASIISLLLGVVFWYLPRAADSVSRHKAVATPSGATSAQQAGDGAGIDDILLTLGSKDLTELQKIQFIRRHSGKQVQWTGIVSSVTPLWKNDPKSEILVILYSQTQKHKNFPDLFAARFSSSSEPDLAGLSSGDTVVVEGTMKPSDFGIDKPSLESARLISFTKGK